MEKKVITTLISDVEREYLKMMRAFYTQPGCGVYFLNVSPKGNISMLWGKDDQVAYDALLTESGIPFQYGTGKGFEETASPSWGIFEWVKSEDGKYIGDFETKEFETYDSLEYSELEEMKQEGWERFNLSENFTASALKKFSEDFKRVETELKEWIDGEVLSQKK